MPDILPKPKPKNFTKILDMLNTKAAANQFSTKTYTDLVLEFSKKAYDNNELSDEEYADIVEPLKGDTGIMLLEQIQKEKDYINSYAIGGRVGYKEKGNVKLSDYLKVNASGSVSGKQQIEGAPEGITSQKQYVNLIAKLDIPMTEKLNILADATYGKYRDKIKYNGKEIFVDDPASYRDMNLGMGYNQGGEGISGSAMRNLKTGDNDFKINFNKKIDFNRLFRADGGRIGLKNGTDYWAMVTEMYIKSGGQEATGMDIQKFADKYFND